MSSGTQQRFEQFPTLRAILTRVFQSNGNPRYTEYLAPILQPLRKYRSRPIRDRLRPLAVWNHQGKQQIPRGSPFPALSGLESRYSIQSQEPKTWFLALSKLLQIFSKTPVSNPDFTPGQGSIVRPFRDCRTPKMQEFERLLPQIQVTKIFNSLTRGLGVEIMQSHLPPQNLNPWHSLGEAIGFETGVQLRIEPLGPNKKLWGEDRTLGAQFSVISRLVFQPVSDATIDAERLSLRRYTTLSYSTPIKSRLNKDGALNPFFFVISVSQNPIKAVQKSNGSNYSFS
jgi:hypothetical protein